MAFQKKYYYSFGSVFNNSYTVEIWQNTGATLTAEQITGAYDPFKVMYPLAQRFEPVRGSGADINIISTESMKFVNLYTADKFEYQVKLLSGSTLLWIGYLDTELYSEPFNEKNNYTVSITANDGLALLERIEYLQANGTAYTGFSKNWDIIKNILLKLGLAWNNVYVYLSTTSDEVTQYIGEIPLLENILDVTYSNNLNYYDEDITDGYPYGKPMSCRDVLESILTPFGAYIQIINGNVYITDNNVLATNTPTDFYKYNGTTLAYVDMETLTLDIGDVSAIKFAEAEQTLNILSPVFKETIKYSPYISETLIDYSADDDTFSGYSRNTYYGSSPYTWYEKEYNLSKSWTINEFLTINNQYRFCEMIGTGDNTGKSDKYLKLKPTDSILDTITYSGYKDNFIVDYVGTNYIYIGEWAGNPTGLSYISYNTNDVVTYDGDYYLCNSHHYPDESTPPPNVYFDLTTASIIDPPAVEPKRFYLKIDAKCYIRITDNMGSLTNSELIVRESTKLCVVETKLSVGSKYYNNLQWTDDLAYFDLRFVDYNDNYEMNGIAEKWVDLSNSKNETVIPFFGFTGNSFDFSLRKFKVYSDVDNITSLIKDVRLKDIKFTILDENRNEIENFDVEYTSFINKLAKSDVDDIDILLGTNKTNIPTSKGSIIGNNNGYFYIQEFTRGGTTDQIEHLLARSLHSNYKDKSIEIQCTINKIGNLFGTLSYDNYFSGKVFGIQEAEINYHEDNIQLTIQELKADDPNLEIKITY